MPRILVLYASLGSGHKSAALALKSAFARHPEVEVRVEDALEHASTVMRQAITVLYEGLSEKTPQLYRLIYEGSDAADLDDPKIDNVLLAKLERPFMKKLEHLVKDFDPDAVICVQQIPSRFLNLLEKEGEIDQTHYVVITDVIAHSTWINYSVDGYFLPSQLTADFLVERGVDRDLLHVTGIPVDPEIAEPKSMREVRLRHDLPVDAPIVTLFGGGLHPKRVLMMVERMLESPDPGLLVVAVGRNESLAERLSNITDGKNMKFRLLGLIDYVDDLVAASDLVITKAGGLITSEVLARGTPMIIIDPFPGQEEWNADMVAASGAGIQLRLPEMVPPAALQLLNEPEQLAFMRQQAQKIGQPEAALRVADVVLEKLRSRTLEIHAR